MCYLAFSQQQKSRTNVYFLGLFPLLFIFLFNVELMAQGSINIAPKRVIFEGQKRIMEVNLANVGKDSAKYSISFLQIRMKEDGTFEEITTPDPGQKFADKNIRFFPRSVMLGSGESQVIRLQLIKSDQLEPGEYRSHLYFRSLASQKALGVDEIKRDSSVSINIAPVFGISIPVIIRVGESTTSLNITDIKLDIATDGISKLHFIINRTGNMSAYGYISILHIAPNGKETQIGQAGGIVIYAPNILRRVQIDLDEKMAVNLSKGTIRIVYSSLSDTHPEKLAEAELAL